MRPTSLVHSALMLSLALSPIMVCHAQTRDAKLSGMGIRKCSEWLQWKDASDSSARAAALEWAHGFISGHNIYARSGPGAASSVVVDSKVLVPLLDAYCQKNPDSRLVLGVIGITQSLGGARINMVPKAPATPSAPKPDKKGERDI